MPKPANYFTWQASTSKRRRERARRSEAGQLERVRQVYLQHTRQTQPTGQARALLADLARVLRAG